MLLIQRKPQQRFYNGLSADIQLCGSLIGSAKSTLTR